MKKDRIAIIGAGRVGSNLAIQLNRCGFPVGAIISRRIKSARKLASRVDCAIAAEDLVRLPDDVNIIFITATDRNISAVAQQLVDCAFAGAKKYIYHLSGVHDSTILDVFPEKSAFCGSMHPIQTFLPIEYGLTGLDGVYWGIEGGEKALLKAEEMILALKGIPFRISADMKVLYHAGCVVASNYLVALVQMTARIFEQFGLSENEAIKLITPLLETTYRNIKKSGIPASLTGPVSRGDADVVKMHVEALREKLPELLAAYRGLGQILVQLTQDREMSNPQDSDKFQFLL